MRRSWPWRAGGSKPPGRAGGEKPGSCWPSAGEVSRLGRKDGRGLDEKQLLDKLWETYELLPRGGQTPAGGVEESVSKARPRIAEAERRGSPPWAA